LRFGFVIYNFDSMANAHSRKSAKKFSALPLDKQIRLIEQALHSSVSPMLAMHGGGMEIMDIKGNDVVIKYYGACAGCALAGTGTLQLIEETLRSQVDEEIRVIPV